MRRSLWLLLALVVAQLFLLSGQAAEEGGEPGLLARWLLAVAAPVGHAIDGAADGLGGLAARLERRSRLEEENARLRQENLALAEGALRERALLLEIERLRGAVGYQETWGGKLRAADIVYIDHTSWLQTALLAVAGGGVRRNQPVVTPDGLLGRVVGVTGRYAKVQLVTDRASSVGAMVERTRRQGLVRGAGRGALALDFIPLQEDLQPGDRLLTAGIDGIYPRGLPIGTITEVAPGEGLFHRVAVSPAVDFARLDHAYVLEVEPLPEAARQPGLEGEP